jgi:hypothetical protein
LSLKKASARVTFHQMQKASKTIRSLHNACPDLSVIVEEMVTHDDKEKTVAIIFINNFC